MPIISLKLRCIKTICLNLSLFKRILEERNIILPTTIGNSLFHYTCDNPFLLNNSNTDFFKYENVLLSDIVLSDGICKNLNSLKFLKNQTLKKLEIFHLSEEICNGLPRMPSLEHLSIYYSNLNYEFLQNCKNLKSLKIYYKKENNLSIERMFHCLNSCSSSLEEFYFPVIFQENNNIVHLTSNIRNFKNLTVLYLDFRKATRENLSDMISSFKSISKNLQTINFSFSQLNGREGTAFGELLKVCSVLENFELRQRNFLSQFSLEQICSGLNNICKTLRYISFKSCFCYNKQLITISDFLINCYHLKSFEIYGNGLFSDGAKSIFKALESSANSLLHFFLLFNFNDRETVKSYCEFLKKCSSLQKIYINSFFYPEEYSWDVFGSFHLFQISLLEFEMSNFEINTGISLVLSKFLKRCCNLKNVRINSIKFSENSFEHFCSGLTTSSKSLETLSISNCYLNLADYTKLKNLLKNCTSLLKLTIAESSNFEMGLTEILTGLIEIAKNSLEDIGFFYCDFTCNNINQLIEFLKICYRLQNINIRFDENIRDRLNLNTNTFISNLTKLKETIEKADISGSDVLQDEINFLVENWR